MLKGILILMVLYFIYKLVFGFILPVSKATTQVRSKIKEMQQAETHNQQQPSAKPQNASSPKEGDYIDFEEIK